MLSFDFDDGVDCDTTGVTHNHTDHFPTPNVIAQILRKAGFSVEEQGWEAATWTATDGTPMEAVSFVAFRRFVDGEEVSSPGMSTVVRPVGAGLNGCVTRVEGPWGVYVYPAGKDPAVTGIRVSNPENGLFGGPRPMFTDEELEGFFEDERELERELALWEAPAR